MKIPLFPLGRTVMTPGADRACKKAGIEPAIFIMQHASAEWGDMDPQDSQQNDRHLAAGQGILHSCYWLSPTVKVWVITDWDRSVTTLLLPDEY